MLLTQLSTEQYRNPSLKNSPYAPSNRIEYVKNFRSRHYGLYLQMERNKISVTTDIERIQKDALYFITFAYDSIFVLLDT